MRALENAVYEAVGEASMCWVETPQGEFDSTRAKDVGDRLLGEILLRHGIAQDLLYDAWAIIANASDGWESVDPEWRAAAIRWRDRWHATLSMDDEVGV